MIEIFAHRGASKEAPENSILAIQKALDIGVDGIEIDILLTEDEIPIVMHNGPLPIEKMKYSEIRKIDLGSGERVPTLVQVLDLLKPHSCKIILDLKKQPGLATTIGKIVGERTRASFPPERLIASSFHPSYLKAFKKQNPDVKLGWIVSRPIFTLVPMGLFARLVSIRSFHPKLSRVTPQLVARCHAKGWKVYCWTLNRQEEIARAVSLKVDGFFTDDPRLAKIIVGKG